MKPRLLRIALPRDTDIVLARRAPAGSRNCSATICTPRPASRPRSRKSPATRSSTAAAAQSSSTSRRRAAAALRNRRCRSRPRHRRLARARRAGQSRTGMGIGLSGARRLMDDFAIETGPERGTTVTIARTAAAELRRRRGELAASSPRRWPSDAPADPVEEIRQQNHEMLLQLQELERRRDELHAAQPGTAGHQSRRRGSLCRTRRAGRPSAARRRAEIAFSVEHDARVPHTAQFDPRADAAAARRERRRADGGAADAGRSSSAKPPKTSASWSTTCSIWPGSRPARRRSSPVEFTADSLFGALRGMLRPLLVGDAVALVFDDCTTICRRSSPRSRRCRRSCATSSPTRSSSRRGARSASGPTS